MTRLFFALATVLVCSVADAQPLVTTCYSGPLPATPIQPVYQLTGHVPSGYVHFDVWRQLCADGDVAGLVKATPITSPVFVCSSDFVALPFNTQTDAQIMLRLLESSGGDAFCGDISVSKIFMLDAAPGQPAWDKGHFFTLVYNGNPPTEVVIPFECCPNHAPQPLKVEIIITGCNPCKVGDFAELHLGVTSLGLQPRAVEVKVGSRFPDGNQAVFLGRYVEMAVPGGQSTIAIPGVTLPAGLPIGKYLIEAALLEPDLGVTEARHSVQATLYP